MPTRVAVEKKAVTARQRAAPLWVLGLLLSMPSTLWADSDHIDCGPEIPRTAADDFESRYELPEPPAARELTAQADPLFASQRFDEALPLYLKAAELGDARAMRRLGVAHEQGLGYPLEIEKALEWYRSGAKAGDAKALFNIGSIYYNGAPGVPQDLVAARHAFERAASLGYPDSIAMLGSLYEDAQVVPRNYATALDYYKKAADLGLGKAMYGVGLQYEMGHGVPDDPAAALNWYFSAMRAGVADGAHRAGLILLRAHNALSDRRALCILQKAYNAGDKEAAAVIGNAYVENFSGFPNYPQAIHWYSIGAAADDPFSINRLAMLYYFGDGVKRDPEKARTLLSSLADAGDIYGIFGLGRIAEYSKDYSAAATWFEKAASLHFHEAQFALGLMNELGQGMPRDPVKAVGWYKLAADQGHAGAMNNLGCMFGRGEGVPQSTVIATMWLQRAAAHGDSDAQGNLARLQAAIAVNVATALWENLVRHQSIDEEHDH